MNEWFLKPKIRMLCMDEMFVMFVMFQVGGMII